MLKKKSSAVYEILLGRLADLPTLPDIIYELNRQFQKQNELSPEDIAHLVALDPSLSMQVFKLANSPKLRRQQGPQTHLLGAIQSVGPDMIRNMLLSTSIIMTNSAPGESEFRVDAFWRHCVGVAVASETLAVWVGEKRSQLCMLAGLLHDVGKTVLYTIDRQDFLATSQYAFRNNLSFERAETQLGMASHAHWGYVLAKKWGLPIEVQQAIRFHHEHRADHRQGIPKDNQPIVDIVFLANLLIHAMNFGNSGYNQAPGVRRELLQRLNLNEEDLRGLVGVIHRNLSRAENFLKIIQDSAA